jgi:hypothetical protein
MIVLVLIAAATASPPLPLLPPPWVQLANARDGEYARYSRHESDGTYSIVSAMSGDCNICSPTAEARLGEKIWLANYPSATVSYVKTMFCGRDATRLLALGITQADPKMSNVEKFFFRDGQTIYSLSFSFHEDQPPADAEQALASLCPAS